MNANTALVAAAPADSIDRYVAVDPHPVVVHANTASPSAAAAVASDRMTP